MGCNCGNKNGGAAKQTSYQVKLPNGGIKSYRTAVEAKAAASRTGGTCQNC